MIEEVCKKEKCTGCFVCKSICPKDAIQCGTDENGKSIPRVLADKCIECGLCIKTCPANSPVHKSYPLECYASWSKDKDERKNCSSGGIATEYAKMMIEQGGIVYGAAFNEELKLVHTRVDCAENLQRLKGSKYVQSYSGEVLKKIKEDLNEDRKVMFVGTPCQVAGVRAYLGKEYDNLLLIDLICHGTPPMQYLEEYIEKIAGGKKITDITCRGEKDYCLTLWNGKKVEYSKRSKKDYYFWGFLQGIIFRDNCYACEYATEERCSDITIGDFWGLDKKSLKTVYSGRISVVLINTTKGKESWKQVEQRVNFEQRDVSEAIEGNEQLRKASVCHPDRDYFLQMYPKRGFVEAIQTPQMKRAISVHRFTDSLVWRAVRKIKRMLR